MGKNLSTDQIIEQSKAAYNQWKDQWRDHAKQHKAMKIEKTFMDYANIGVGRALLIVGNGHSLEEEIETIKKYQHNIDIMVCDKAMGHLFDHDIVPTYVVVCDANVSYEKYCKPWEDRLWQSHLFINACGNPEWTKQEWRSKLIFVNMDSIKSEKEFSELSGSQNFIPAATNVSNQMAVLATQSTNKGRNNWMGYDKIVLIGFDYCWEEDKYYAFNATGDGKNNYMRHAHCMTRDFRPVYSSSNLIFSAKWLDDYIGGFKLPFVVGTKKTLLRSCPSKDLEMQLKYRYSEEDRARVMGLSELRMKLSSDLRAVENELNNIGLQHLEAFKNSI